MTKESKEDIIRQYLAFISAREFPCVAAREAASRLQVACMVASHMGCPADDGRIFEFLYDFIDAFRKEKGLFHSAAIIFCAPDLPTEQAFDALMWQRLQSLSDRDAGRFAYDKRVSADPLAGNFSFSIKEEAFFIIGLHPQSSRPTRRFRYPVLVFNPHAQFEKLRESGRYEKMRDIVRKRDIAYSGSVNPMLDDFGQSSEVFQYSGRQYAPGWVCPLKINHGSSQHYSTQERGGLFTQEGATPEGPGPQR
jgi:FPC/CPF motif-containing protein YcgG